MGNQYNSGEESDSLCRFKSQEMTSSTSDTNSSEKKSKFSFSIDHILNQAGTSTSQKTREEHGAINVTPFPWLQCTRYCPPKVQRVQKREGTQKRQLGRHPRIPFTTQQLTILEEKFRESPYLSSAEVLKISRLLQLAEIRVKIWFQNRRARDRREKMQSETDLKMLTSTSNVHSDEECVSLQNSFGCNATSDSSIWTPTTLSSAFPNYAISSKETYLELYHKSIVRDKHSQ